MTFSTSESEEILSSSGDVDHRQMSKLRAQYDSIFTLYESTKNAMTLCDLCGFSDALWVNDLDLACQKVHDALQAIRRYRPPEDPDGDARMARAMALLTNQERSPSEDDMNDDLGPQADSNLDSDQRRLGPGRPQDTGSCQDTEDPILPALIMNSPRRLEILHSPRRQELARRNDVVANAVCSPEMGHREIRRPEVTRYNRFLESPREARKMSWNEDDQENLDPNSSSSPSVGGGSKSRRRWLPEEVDQFLELLSLYGPFQWVQIHRHSTGALCRRDNLQLKDKWRNMVKFGMLGYNENGQFYLWRNGHPIHQRVTCSDWRDLARPIR